MSSSKSQNSSENCTEPESAYAHTRYDLNGNLTALPGMTLSYDVFDRAVTITKGAVTTQAKYDAFGRRVEQTLGSGAKRVYFYGLRGELLAEYDSPANGITPSRTYQYLAGRRLGQWTDRTGSVRYLTAGAVYRHYYPFGEEITTTAGDTYKFAELYRDADTGLDYAMARYYSSTAGRFLSADPSSSGAFRLPLPSTLNIYSYVLNDPLNLKDPTGLSHDGVTPDDDCGRREWYEQLACIYPGYGPCIDRSLEEMFTLLGSDWGGELQFLGFAPNGEVNVFLSPRLYEALARIAPVAVPVAIGVGQQIGIGVSATLFLLKQLWDHWRNSVSQSPIECTYVGEFQDSDVDAQWKICYYSCSDGRGRNVSIPVTQKCPARQTYSGR